MRGYSGRLTGRELFYTKISLSLKEKMAKQTNKMGVGVAIGVGIGAALGAALGDIAVGVAIGVAIGAGMGVAMNHQKKPDEDAKPGTGESGEETKEE